MFLAYDVTDRLTTLAWSRGSEIERLSLSEGKATEVLMPAIERILGESNESLQGIGTLCGPGAFTGIRVGLATAEALRLSLGVAVFGFTRFQLIAELVGSGSVVFASGRDQGITASFREGVQIGEPVVRPLEELKDCAPLVCLKPIPQLPEARVLDVHLPERCIQLMAAGAQPDDFPLEPLYVRPADAIAGSSLIAKLLSRTGGDS